MNNYQIKAGSTDVSVVIRIIDSTDGTPETGVVFNTAGIDLQYRRELAASTAITEATLAALTTAHADGGFLHIGNGYYRLDLPDAAVASGAVGVLIHGTVTGMVVIGCYIQLLAIDLFDTVRMGLTALPNAAAEAAGGLYTRGSGAGQINQPANGQIDANVEKWNATDVPAENTAGYPIVTIKDGTGTGEIDTASGRVAITETQIDQIVDEVWDELKSGHTTPDSFGDYLDDEITSRALAGDAMALTAAAVDAIWDEDVDASHQTAGSAGKKLDDAGGAADPWATALPGAYGAGTAGKIVGDNLNATVSSRSSHSAADIWAVATRELTAFSSSFKTGYALSSAGVQAIWDALTSALTTAGSIGKLLVDNVNASISAVKSKTDQLTFTNTNKVDSSLQAAGDLVAAVANKIADHVLRRTYANARASSDGDTFSFRSLMGAVAKLVNKWTLSAGNLTIYHEDDTTSAGTQVATTNASAEPITTLDTS